VALEARENGAIAFRRVVNGEFDNDRHGHLAAVQHSKTSSPQSEGPIVWFVTIEAQRGRRNLDPNVGQGSM
jgi:hypothetical protein